MESVVQSYDFVGSNIADVVANFEWFTYRSIYVSVWLNLIYLSNYLCICLTESIWLTLSSYRSIYLSVYLSDWIYLNRSVPVSAVIPPVLPFSCFFLLPGTTPGCGWLVCFTKMSSVLENSSRYLGWIIHQLELHKFKNSICWFFVQDVKNMKHTGLHSPFQCWISWIFPGDTWRNHPKRLVSTERFTPMGSGRLEEVPPPQISTGMILHVLPVGHLCL